MKTKEIEIEHEGKKETITIRRMGWAEKNTFTDKYFKVEIIGDQPKVNVKTFEMRTGAMQLCIHKAPFKTDVTTLNELDPDMLEGIYKEISKFNKLDAIQKKKLFVQSGEQNKVSP